MEDRHISRKDAKTQRVKPLGSFASLCAFASLREPSSLPPEFLSWNDFTRMHEEEKSRFPVVPSYLRVRHFSCMLLPLREALLSGPTARLHTSLVQRPRTSVHETGRAEGPHYPLLGLMVRAFSPELLWRIYLGRCPRLVCGRAFGAESRFFFPDFLAS